MKANAGNRGEKVRSDCYVELELCDEGGVQFDLKSKVEALYGNSIRALCCEVLSFFEIDHCKLFVEDKGALNWVIAARLEAAIKRLTPNSKSFLSPVDDKLNYTTEKKCQRRSRLYIPGVNPKLMLNAGLYGADGIIFDLEDAVAPGKKYESRFLVRNALRAIDLNGAERMVRINQLPEGLKDIEVLANQPVNLILIPKCESAADIHAVNSQLNNLSSQKTNSTHLMPIVESAKGVLNAFEIATAAENVVAIAIGLEDYTADMGIQRTASGNETQWARNMVVNAAVAAGIQPIDSVFSDVENMEALEKNINESRSIGFVGMGCIHPRQIKPINSGYSPSEKEIEKAKRVVDAFMKAKEKGLGVVALGSKMIDAPVVKRAQQTIDNAIANGLLNQNWRENHET
jgi:citrate lyase subunit beta/citryl-CoA lyase